MNLTSATEGKEYIVRNIVTEDEELIAAVRKSLAKEKIEAFVRDMSVLGYRKQDMIILVKETLEGEDNYG